MYKNVQLWEEKGKFPANLTADDVTRICTPKYPRAFYDSGYVEKTKPMGEKQPGDIEFSLPFQPFSSLGLFILNTEVTSITFHSTSMDTFVNVQVTLDEEWTSKTIDGLV